jgi:hypothetical protein
MPGLRYLLERYFEISDERSVFLFIVEMLDEGLAMPCGASSPPKISQNIPVGEHTARTPVPFLVHLSMPISVSIDFSHEGSLSTSHLGILFCITIRLTDMSFIVFANDRIYSADMSYNLKMAKRDKTKTHAYSAQRSGSKKYAKVERRKRHKPR